MKHETGGERVEKRWLNMLAFEGRIWVRVA